MILDIVRCDINKEMVERKMEECRSILEERGLRISKKKTIFKLQRVNTEHMGVYLAGEKLERREKFEYLGSTRVQYGGLDTVKL